MRGEVQQALCAGQQSQPWPPPPTPLPLCPRHPTPRRRRAGHRRCPLLLLPQPRARPPARAAVLLTRGPALCALGAALPRHRQLLLHRLLPPVARGGSFSHALVSFCKRELFLQPGFSRKRDATHASFCPAGPTGPVLQPPTEPPPGPRPLQEALVEVSSKVIDSFGELECSAEVRGALKRMMATVHSQVTAACEVRLQRAERAAGAAGRAGGRDIGCGSAAPTLTCHTL